MGYTCCDGKWNIVPEVLQIRGTPTAKMVKTYTLIEYSVMTEPQRKRLSNDDQFGQPAILPEDTLKNIIKDTIEKRIEERIPEDFAKMITEVKKEYTERIDKIANENKTLKMTILEQQKFLEEKSRRITYLFQGYRNHILSTEMR